MPNSKANRVSLSQGYVWPSHRPTSQWVDTHANATVAILTRNLHNRFRHIGGPVGTKSRKRAMGMTVRRLRKSIGLSQQAIAATVGVHVNTVARWESDGIHPCHWALPLILALLASLGGQPPHRLVPPNLMHRGKGRVRVESNGLGQIKEFNHIDPALAALQARYPRLLLTQDMRELLLAQTDPLALVDQ